MSKILLVFSMPRSGSTWLGKLFDSQRTTALLHEPDSVAENASLPLCLDAGPEGNEALVAQARAWLATDDEKVIASRPIFDKDYLSRREMVLRTGLAYLNKAWGIAAGNTTRLSSSRVGAGREALTVWKSIESLGRMPALLPLLGARGIHLMRHPCGHVASTLRGVEKGLFAQGLPIWEDFDLFDKLLTQTGESRYTPGDVRAMTPEERLALRWGLINDFAHTRLRDHEHYRLLDYEALCARPHEHLESVFSFAGLAIDRQVEGYLRDSTSGSSEGYYSTYKDSGKTAGKWREELGADAVERVLAISSQFSVGQPYSA